jgi:hypothetical protein
MLDAEACQALVDAIPPVKTRGLTVRLSAIDCDNPDNAAWLGVFFTDGELRKDLAGSALDKAAPHLRNWFCARRSGWRRFSARRRVSACSTALRR